MRPKWLIKSVDDVKKIHPWPQAKPPKKRYVSILAQKPRDC
jgi:hypothetical protein